MNKRTRNYALSVTPWLLATLSGCATFDKCAVGTCVGDREITAGIRRQLDSVPTLSQEQITVQTIDQVVYLSGLIEAPMDDDAAVAIARNTAGVEKVVDWLAIGP